MFSRNRDSTIAFPLLNELLKDTNETTLRQLEERALGFKIVWPRFWARLRNPSKNRRRKSSSQYQNLGFQTLEPRKVLASVAAVDHTHIDGLENELIETSIVFSEISGDQDYVLSVDLGDGSASLSFGGLAASDIDGTVVNGQAGFPLELQYADDGEYILTADLHDDQGAFVDSRMINVSIHDRVAEITQLDGFGLSFSGESYTFGSGELVTSELNEGESFSFSVTFKDGSANDLPTVQLDLGDGTDLIDLAFTSSSVHPDTSASFTFESPITLSYADDGLYAARLILTDNDAVTTEYHIAADVLDVAPEISITTSQTTVLSGQQLAIKASATDAGSDTVGQWQIDWGDGSNEIVSGAVAASAHAWSQPGNYQVQVWAINEDLKTDPTVLTVQVLTEDGETASDNQSAAIQFQGPTSVVTQTDAAWKYTLHLLLTDVDFGNVDVVLESINGVPATNASVDRLDDRFELDWTTPATTGVYRLTFRATDTTNPSTTTPFDLTVGLTPDVQEFNRLLLAYRDQLQRQTDAAGGGIDGFSASLAIGSVNSGVPFLTTPQVENGSDGSDDSGSGDDPGDLTSGGSTGDGVGLGSASNPYGDSTQVDSGFTESASNIANGTATASTLGIAGLSPLEGQSTAPNVHAPTTGELNEDPTSGGVSPDQYGVAQETETPNEVHSPYADAFTPVQPLGLPMGDVGSEPDGSGGSGDFDGTGGGSGGEPSGDNGIALGGVAQ